MYVFSHLHKAAGTTVVHLLRRSFGLNHLDAVPVRGHIYTGDDMSRDLRFFGKPLSIAGHGLRPHVDYGETDREMNWYTIIRNPLDRCISHYQHQVQKMSSRRTFMEWISVDLHRNWMVYFYGGSNSLQKAVDALGRRSMRVIDVADGLRPGMETLFPVPLLWRDRVANPARNNRIRREILENDRMLNELESANRLDMELYRFMKEMGTAPLPSTEAAAPRNGDLNLLLGFLFRNSIYRPSRKLLRLRGGRRG